MSPFGRKQAIYGRISVNHELLIRRDKMETVYQIEDMAETGSTSVVIFHPIYLVHVVDDIIGPARWRFRIDDCTPLHGLRRRFESLMGRLGRHQQDIESIAMVRLLSSLHYVKEGEFTSYVGESVVLHVDIHPDVGAKLELFDPAIVDAIEYRFAKYRVSTRK